MSIDWAGPAISAAATVAAAAVNGYYSLRASGKGKTQSPRSHGRFAVIGGLTCVATLAAVTGWLVGRSDSTNSRRPLTASAAGIDIDQPTASVPLCPRIRGTGRIPDEQELWIVVRPKKEDGDYYLSGRAQDLGDGRWAVDQGDVGLGEGRPGEVGEKWRVYAILFEKAYSEYLTDLRVAVKDPPPASGETELRLSGAFSTTEPPNLGDSPHIDVTRSDDVNC